MQAAFRGALVCQGLRKSSLPGKAGGFRVQEDTVERHGGLDVVMEKIDQREQETPTSNEREMIDVFRLWGSRTWRQMAFHPFDGGEEIWHGSDPATHNASLSEGKAFAVVVQVVPGSPHWKRVGTECPNPLR